MQNKKTVLISIVVLIAIFVGGTLFYKNNQAQKMAVIAKEQAQLFQRDYSYVKGNKEAKLQLVEFFDPACGTCADFHFRLKDYLKDKKDIKLVLRYAPFHQNSNYAVKMLEGARAQGLFMETLEFMFQTQRYWIQNHVVNPQMLWRVLGKVEGLDMEKLGKAMNDPKADEIIKQDLADAEKLGADKTPSYFVNGKPLEKFGWDTLVKLIESEM